MNLEDDELPKRGRGRPMRGIEEGMAPVPGARVDTPRCKLCEKRDVRRSWCPIRAAPCGPDAPMCKWGLVLHRARKLRERRSANE